MNLFRYTAFRTHAAPRMVPSRLVVLGSVFAMSVAASGAALPTYEPDISADTGMESVEVDPFVLDHEADRITGEAENLEDAYLGDVLLIVNVASRCGYTKQYAELEELYRAHKDDGLVVLGFPADDVGGQEPGSDAEIMEFCSSRFDVTFPMFAKIAVTGDGTHPLYQDLAQQAEPIGGAPKWNFTKFLVNRSGEVIARFEPADAPMGDKLRAAVEAALANLTGEEAEIDPDS